MSCASGWFVFIRALHTMFNQLSNTACNNIVFNDETIVRMHPSMVMLYDAAKASKNTEGQTEVAKAMNVSPQRMNNWEARGISKEGALIAQEVFGCDANVLRGKHQLAQQTNTTIADANEVREESLFPWLWPFKAINVKQYAILDDHQKKQVEDYILLQIKARAPPEKHPSPASNISQQRAA